MFPLVTSHPQYADVLFQQAAATDTKGRGQILCQGCPGDVKKAPTVLREGMSRTGGNSHELPACGRKCALSDGPGQVRCLILAPLETSPWQAAGSTPFLVPPHHRVH